MRFSEFVDKWKCGARGVKTSKSWALTQDQVLKDHILPILGSLSLNKIKPADISKVINASVDRGHAPNTTKKIYMVLSKVFADAVEFFEYIDKSPVKRQYHQPFVPPVKRPYETLETSLVVLEYVMNHALYALPIWIMLLGGLRVSEVESLSWPDIDFEKEIIHVRSSYCITSHEFRNYTKNKNQYTVPLAPMLRAFLWNRRKDSGLICQSDETFWDERLRHLQAMHKQGRISAAQLKSRKDNLHMMSRYGLKEYIRTLQKKLNLQIRSSHGLRHSCARILVEYGASDEQIKEMLGHRWLVSAKTYTHRDGTDFLRKVVKKIA